MREHEECHAKAYLKMTGHRSPTADIRNYFPGTVVDRCMRQWLNSDDPQPGQMVAMADTMLDTAEVEAKETGDGIVRWRTPGDKDEVRAFCKELLGKLEPLLLRHAIPLVYQPAVRFPPQKLTLPHPAGGQRQVLLTGEIDLLTQDGAKHWRIWDLKATRNKDYYRHVIGQLVFYEVAIWLWKGEWPVESGLIQPMLEPAVLSFTFSEGDRQQMFYRISKVASEIWREVRDPKADAAGCDRCEVKHACPKYAVPGGRGRASTPW